MLATRYDLSDAVLAEALSDRASFRRFCGFSCAEATPERTAFVRFRRELLTHGLDRNLFEAISRDLESKGACVRKGTLIDATVIGAAAKGDKEAAWVRHRTRPPAHGYKAHIAADKDTGIIREVETTAANEPDVAIAPAIIPDHLKTPLTFSLDATDRACQSQTPGPSRRYRLQSQTLLAHAPKRILKATLSESHFPRRAQVSKHFGTMARNPG